MIAHDTSTVRALFGRLVDYAGLFPPAALDLPEAIQLYAGYARGPWAWMLGRFVMPAGQLQTFVEAASDRLPAGETSSWRIAAQLSEAREDDLARVAAFNLVHAGAGGALVDLVETRVASADDVRRLAASVPEGLRLACEVPGLTDCDEILDAIVEARAIAKMRTGGTAASAVPSTTAVAAFLLEAARRDLLIKGTAGLHHALRGDHPLTYEPDAARAPMHGFLNLLLAAALACAKGPDKPGAPPPQPPTVADLARLLEKRTADTLSIAAEGVTWDEYRIASTGLTRVRSACLSSIGSCSFEEPIDDLRRLGLAGA